MTWVRFEIDMEIKRSDTGHGDFFNSTCDIEDPPSKALKLPLLPWTEGDYRVSNELFEAENDF